MNGQQFDGGDAQVEQVPDGGLVPQPGVGAAQFFWYAGVAHGEAFYVDLVYDRVRVPAPLPVTVMPVESGLHD
jgi:hypothetical protein